jgi:hypothetical protein
LPRLYWPIGSSHIFFLVLAVHFCMDRTIELINLISGNDQFGRVNLGRVAPAAAVRKAKELLQESYLDVRISTPRSLIPLSDEFDQLEG